MLPLHVVGSDFSMAEVQGNKDTGTSFNIKNTSTGGKSWGIISTGTNSVEGDGRFLIKDFDTDETRMTIDQNGYIGIGIINPMLPLHVVGSDFSMAEVQGDKDTGTSFNIKNTSTGGKSWGIISTGTNSVEGDGRFLIKDFDTDETRMTIDQNGNIGIGTISPTDILTVQDSVVSSTGGVIHATYTKTVNGSDRAAVRGTSVPRDGFGYGVLGEGGYRAVYGINPGGDYTGTTYGGYFLSTANSGIAGTRYGVYGSASGGGGNGTRYGVYGTATGGATNWAGYFNQGNVYVSNDLRIGSTAGATGYKLSVDGKVICEELKIEDSGSWPDYVFEDDYRLRTLEEVEASIEENGHLPGIPSATQITEDGGYHIGDMQRRTIEKVEELTLYLIESNKQMKALQTQNEALLKRIEELEDKK